MCAEAVTHEVGEGDTIRVGALEVAVIETPCHTVGHVCYHVGGEAVFTGDTLFVAGCGNFNTGSPQQMHDAFAKLGALPDDTLLFVGHECKFTRVKRPASCCCLQRACWRQFFESRVKVRHATHATRPSVDGVDSVVLGGVSGVLPLLACVD